MGSHDGRVGNYSSLKPLETPSLSGDTGDENGCPRTCFAGCVGRLRRRQSDAFVHIEVRWLDARKDRFRACYDAGRSVRQDQKRVGLQRAPIFESSVLWDGQAVDRSADCAGAAELDRSLKSGEDSCSETAKSHDGAGDWRNEEYSRPEETPKTAPEGRISPRNGSVRLRCKSQ
jgi:hypothetical protein